MVETQLYKGTLLNEKEKIKLWTKIKRIERTQVLIKFGPRFFIFFLI